MNHFIWKMEKLITVSFFIIFGISEMGFAGTSGLYLGNPPDRKMRQEQAKEWKVVFEKLNDQIPNLSPESTKWVMTEEDEAVEYANKGEKGDRLLNLWGSKEYNVFIVKGKTKEILMVLNGLLDEKLPEKQEMLLWIELSTYFTNPIFWQSVESLIEFKIIKKEVNDDKGLYLSNHVLKSNAILTRIIRPYIITRNVSIDKQVVATERKSEADKTAPLGAEAFKALYEECQKYRQKIKKELDAKSNPDAAGYGVYYQIERIFYSPRGKSCLYVAQKVENRVKNGTDKLFEEFTLVNAESGEHLLNSGRLEFGTTDHELKEMIFWRKVRPYE